MGLHHAIMYSEMQNKYFWFCWLYIQTFVCENSTLISLQHCKLCTSQHRGKWQPEIHTFICISEGVLEKTPVLWVLTAINKNAQNNYPLTEERDVISLSKKIRKTNTMKKNTPCLEESPFLVSFVLS